MTFVRTLRLIAASLAAALMASAAFAQDRAPEFARVDLDDNEQPRALQMSIHRYVPADGERPIEVDLVGADGRLVDRAAAFGNGAIDGTEQCDGDDLVNPATGIEKACDEIAGALGVAFSRNPSTGEQIGHILMTGKGSRRMSGLNPAQKRTFMTMRALGASPLFMGGNLKHRIGRCVNNRMSG